MEIEFKGYRTNYEMWIEDVRYHGDTDFTVGEGEEYDFTVQECVDSELEKIIDYCAENGIEVNCETREIIKEKLESYFSNHDN